GTMVLLHSTIRPETTKKVYEAARARNVHVIDACMTAVPRVVRQGGLTFLVGGPAELFERAKPHLLTMAKDAIHMGPLGAGNVAKLVKNLVTAAEGLIVYEALRIGKAGGIDYRDALEMLHKTKSESVLDRWQERFDLSDGDLGLRTGANLYDKDVPLAAEVGKSLAVDIPVTEKLAALGLRLSRAKKQTS
ncbi:MAG TPA: NAD-binding protein, partial [Candidatus Binatia bacterium]